MTGIDRLVHLHGYTLTGLRYCSHTLPSFLMGASLSSSVEPPAAEEEEEEADAAPDAVGARPCVHPRHEEEGHVSAADLLVPLYIHTTDCAVYVAIPCPCSWVAGSCPRPSRAPRPSSWCRPPWWWWGWRQLATRPRWSGAVCTNVVRRGDTCQPSIR